MTWPAAAFALLLAFWAFLAVVAMPAAEPELAELAELRRAVLEMQRAVGDALLPVLVPAVEALARWASEVGLATEALARRPRGPDPPADPFGDLRGRYLLGLYHAGRISWDELERARALDRRGP